MHNNQERINTIKQKIEAVLFPSFLEVIDESHKHIGHAGAATGLGHFAINIASPKFQNQNLISCHRLIYEALGELMRTDIHALKIKIL